MAVVAEELARALVYEQQIVAVTIADESIRASLGHPEAITHLVVEQDLRGIPRAVAPGDKPVQVETAGAQGTVAVDPSRGRVRVIHMRRRAVEAFASQLPLLSSRRQVGMSLARGRSLDPRQWNALLHRPSPSPIPPARA